MMVLKRKEAHVDHKERGRARGSMKWVKIKMVFFSVSVNVAAVRGAQVISTQRRAACAGKNRGMDMGAVSAAGSIGMLLKRQNHCLFSSFFCRCRPSVLHFWIGKGEHARSAGSPPPSPSPSNHQQAGHEHESPILSLSIHRSQIKLIGIANPPSLLTSDLSSSPMII